MASWRKKKEGREGATQPSPACGRGRTEEVSKASSRIFECAGTTWFRLHNSGSGSHFGSAPFPKLLQKWALLDMPRVGRDVHIGKAQELSGGDFRYFQAIEF